MEKEYIVMKELTIQQKAAIELIRSDLRYLSTITQNYNMIKSNYMVSLIPYYSMIIDGTESWIAAMNNSAPSAIEAPRFTEEEKLFYDATRQSIKLWERPYKEIYECMGKYYKESDSYFSSACKPIIKKYCLYNIFGADLADNHFCGNTILGTMSLPDYHLNNRNYGSKLKALSEIGGRYIAVFDAMTPYEINPILRFQDQDYGGFRQSPVGNVFSYRFVLFSILCQINFIIYAVNQYIVPEVPTKLRFAYILYYYLCDILADINAAHNTSFSINRDYYSQEFRNAMAHYKVGVYLKAHEIVPKDPMYGMTQKAFMVDYYHAKNAVYTELTSLSMQIEQYLGLNQS